MLGNYLCIRTCLCILITANMFIRRWVLLYELVSSFCGTSSSSIYWKISVYLFKFSNAPLHSLIIYPFMWKLMRSLNGWLNWKLKASSTESVLMYACTRRTRIDVDVNFLYLSPSPYPFASSLNRTLLKR